MTTTARKPIDKAKVKIDVSAMDQVIGYRLRRAQHYVFQEFGERFADYKIRPSEYSILVLIEDNPGRRQTEIAGVLGIKRANFVALIHGLETRGLIETRQPPEDRRSHALFLTAEGAKMVAAIRTTQEEFEAHCVDKLGGVAARDQLMALLDRLTPG
jgi:DNA-binding MarR family transcriptional regulator